ncbi:MAG TPA: DUF6364 family protein [Thermoanaerobaculia bacterium]|jgi:hypothetical protein
MNAKLTLRLDDELIRKAKSHAKRVGKPVSQIVEEYFAVLTAPPRRGQSEPTPRVRRLKGILRGADVDEDAYRRHLEDKYL